MTAGFGTRETLMNGAILHWRRSARLGVVVLAIVAVSWIPFRALCDLGLAHAAQTTSTYPVGHGDGESGLCCSSVDDQALLDDSIAPGHPEVPGEVPLVASIVPVLILSALMVRQPRGVEAPPLSPSYYARSARILR